MGTTATQSQIDRAHEWASEHFEGPTDGWDAYLEKAIDDIVDLDADADEREARLA